MEQYEIDKLVDEIQGYLNLVGKGEDYVGAPEGTRRDDVQAGLFIQSRSRKKMHRFLMFSKYAHYGVEALTIGLLTTVMLSPFDSWPRTAMFVTGTLLFGIFTITVLLGMQTRIRLLLQIEANTQNIALTKTRIAETLEKFRLG